MAFAECWECEYRMAYVNAGNAAMTIKVTNDPILREKMLIKLVQEQSKMQIAAIKGAHANYDPEHDKKVKERAAELLQSILSKKSDGGLIVVPPEDF